MSIKFVDFPIIALKNGGNYTAYRVFSAIGPLFALISPFFFEGKYCGMILVSVSLILIIGAIVLGDGFDFVGQISMNSKFVKISLNGEETSIPVENLSRVSIFYGGYRYEMIALRKMSGGNDNYISFAADKQIAPIRFRLSELQYKQIKYYLNYYQKLGVKVHWHKRYSDFEKESKG